MAATGIPRSHETPSSSYMRRLNNRAINLTAIESRRIKDLEGVMRWVDHIDKDDTTYAVVYKEHDGEMTAQISRKKNPTDRHKTVSSSYFWDPESPENEHRQFYRSETGEEGVGFGDEQFLAIDNIISIVEHAPTD